MLRVYPCQRVFATVTHGNRRKSGNLGSALKNASVYESSMEDAVVQGCSHYHCGYSGGHSDQEPWDFREAVTTGCVAVAFREISSDHFGSKAGGQG